MRGSVVRIVLAAVLFAAGGALAGAGGLSLAAEEADAGGSRLSSLRGLLASRSVESSPGSGGGAAAGQSGEGSGASTEETAEEPHGDVLGHYRGTLTESRSGKPIAGAQLIFTDVRTDEFYTAVTDKDGKYEVRMPVGEYRVKINVGKKSYGGTGNFREEVPGKVWALDFVLSSKLTDQDFQLEATPTEVTIKPVYVEVPPRDPHWMEFWIFMAGIAAVAALAE